MRARTLAATALLAAGALAVTACSSAGPAAATFTPGGERAVHGGRAGVGRRQAGSGSYVMPPFGTNVHVDMTSWLPANAAQAQAVNTDKDYELAYLYARKYKGGQDQTWVNYVSSVMQTAGAAVAAGDGRHHRVVCRHRQVLRHERDPRPAGEGGSRRVGLLTTPAPRTRTLRRARSSPTRARRTRTTSASRTS